MEEVAHGWQEKGREVDKKRREEEVKCNGTVQIIRAQVQKQSPKRSNSST
jgi:hypothetical protein